MKIPLTDHSVDLVFTSPPYEDARTYGIDFRLRGQAWVDWAVEGFLECLRVCRGLVAWVVEGTTHDFSWSATPALLMADLHRRGVKLRRPPIYHRVGIPGSGGPDWLRNDAEWIICASDGRLPWADTSAMGSSPKWPTGGALSYRNQKGERRYMKPGAKGYTAPKVANPGNIIRCIAGGGRIGSKLAHETDAPFPEKLAEFFIRSFCPLEGLVLDPFSGSGTTASVATQLGRRAIAGDIRESQVELTRRRLREAQLVMV